MTLSTAAVSGGDPCPCGTGATYATCCAAYVIDGTPPPTAEALMPRTRPDDVSVDEDLRWTGLDLVAVEDGGVDDRSGTVEFVARWVAHGQHGQLQERSTFARRGGRWVYVEATDPTR
jgi:SEC-C motif-containing protein